MAQKIKVISFDLDDTLWSCKPTIVRAEALLYQWLSEHVAVITNKYDSIQLREKRCVLYKQYPELVHDLTRLRLKSFALLSEEFKLCDDWERPAFDVFYQARQQVTLFDDVNPVLDELRHDYTLVSLTNGNADTVLTGVSHWFDFSLNSATVGQSKSEPEIYRQVLQWGNIDAGQMLHIGDDPLNDVSGAKAAGVFAVWLNRKQKPWLLSDCEPDATITSLRALPAILCQL